MSDSAAGRPPSVQQLLTCLQYDHCWSHDGCPYEKSCTTHGCEQGDVQGLLAYIEYLEAS